MDVSGIRVAVATKGNGGLDETVSDVFGRATTFTLIDISESQVKNMKVLQNPAESYKAGAGPIAVKTLIDAGVNIVAAAEFGPGVSTLLKQHDVSMVKVKPGITVTEAVAIAGLKPRK